MNPNPKFNPKDKLMQSELKKAGKIQMDLDDAFFEKMHDRIMSEVEKKTMEPPPGRVEKFKKYMRSKPWGQTLLSHESFAVLILICGLTYQTAQGFIYNKWMSYQTREENLLAAALESPDLSYSLTETRPQHDFFVDVANHSMNDFEYGHLKKLLGLPEERESNSQ